MKSDTLIYGIELLTKLDEIGKEITFPEFEKDSTLKGDELRELLKYLQKKEYLKYTLGLFINETKLGESTIKLLPKGMEVVLGKRDYFSDVDNTLQNIQNQSIINGNQNQVAQTIGNNNLVSQVIDNSQINVLRKLIEEDEELDEPKKNKLFDILEKFNTLKGSGENALELIKKVGGIALKYVPLFFSLLH